MNGIGTAGETGGNISGAERLYLDAVDMARNLRSRWFPQHDWLGNLAVRSSRVGVIPDEFVPSFYRAAHPDLAHLSDDALRDHFEREGKDAGRIASPAALRPGFTAIVPWMASILEIGPFTNPLFRGPFVRYFDMFDREGLERRAVEHNVPTRRAPKIDFVSPAGDLSIVPDACVDYVFSSHCIEHQPDLIQHLIHARRILRPGGRYFLLIPDKRYTYDHFIDASGIDEVLRAHAERRRTHTLECVMTGYAMVTHNDVLRHWRGDHDDPNAAWREARAEEGRRAFIEANGAYIDVHGWQFTPANFRAIMTDLSRREAIPFTVTRVYETVRDSCEFMAILSAR